MPALVYSIGFSYKITLTVISKDNIGTTTDNNGNQFLLFGYNIEMNCLQHLQNNGTWRFFLQ